MSVVRMALQLELSCDIKQSGYNVIRMWMAYEYSLFPEAVHIEFIIGCRSHKQSDKLEVARVHSRFGHRWYHNKRKCVVGCLATSIVWAYGTLTARARCPVGVGNRANSIKVD